MQINMMVMVADKDFDYIGKNGCGHRYNALCSPDERWYGTSYGGYLNNARQVLFYDFAVQGYDVEFKLHGESFHLLYEPDHAALCDAGYSTEYETFANPMDLIENLKIAGLRLIDIIDELEDVEPM